VSFIRSLSFRRWMLLIMLLLASTILIGSINLLSNAPPPASAQVNPTRTLAESASAPPCRPGDLMLHVRLGQTCIEMVFGDVTAPQAAPAQMGITFGPDGTLYSTRTAAGEIWALRDADADGFPEAPVRVAAGLTLPTSLTYHDGALYVASVGGLIRLDGSGDSFDQMTVLVPELSAPTGFWPGSVLVGPDERLYVSLGANCTACQGDDIQPGRLVSYALDGSDPQVIATGLRRAADFGWNPRTGDLWIVDSLTADQPDELNRVVPGVDFGFPACAGDNCAPPSVEFDPQSDPSGLAFYPLDAPPGWEIRPGDLVVVLRGSWDRPEPTGYAVALVRFDEAALPAGRVEWLAPISDYPTYVTYPPSLFSLTRRGFYPQRPADVAISPEGWVYVAVEEGPIYRFRPKSSQQPN
jgi:glucose/arabinose dehydrogenase